MFLFIGAIILLVPSYTPILASPVGRFGQCLTLTPLTSIQASNVTCFGAVDYAFFTPTGVTLNSLEDLARSKLSNQQLSILPAECKASIKTAVCSSIYLKCPSRIFNIFANVTWNDNIFSDVNVQLPVPFQRPCVNICHRANNDCLRMLDILGLGFNCLERKDYSRGIYARNMSFPLPYTYDQSDNSSICNNMPVVVKVADSSEPYIYVKSGGTCSGIITSLYIPPLMLNVAPMQAPYIIQSMLENKTSELVTVLPSWLSTQCHLSLRKYFCGTYMLQPQVKKLGEILLLNGVDLLSNKSHIIDRYKEINISAISELNIHVPGYPEKRICQDYATSCQEFIANTQGLAQGFIAGARLAVLEPKCDRVDNNIYLYPTDKQTVLVLPIANVSVNFQSTPYTMTNSSDAGIYMTVCPQGYVVPDTPDSMSNVYVSGTGCALGCRSPFLYTDNQFKTLENIDIIASAIGLPLIIALIVTWSMDKKKRTKSYLVLIFAINSGLYTLLSIVRDIIFRKGFQQYRCLNNAIQRRQSDGFSLCVLEAIFDHYIQLSSVFCGMLQAVDLMLKICFGWQGWQGSRYFWMQMVFIFGIPCLFVIYGGYVQIYGYSGNLARCLWTLESTDQDIAYISNYPLTAAVFTGCFCMLCVVIEITRTTKSSGHDDSFDQRLMKKIGVIRTSLLFVTFYFLVWISVSLLLYQIANKKEKFLLSSEEWLKCTFNHFDKNHPQIEFGEASWLQLTICGQSLLIAGCYMFAIYAALHEYIWPESSNFVNVQKKGLGSNPQGGRRNAVARISSPAMLWVRDRRRSRSQSFFRKSSFFFNKIYALPDSSDIDSKSEDFRSKNVVKNSNNSANNSANVEAQVL